MARPAGLFIWQLYTTHPPKKRESFLRNCLHQNDQLGAIFLINARCGGAQPTKGGGITPGQVGCIKKQAHQAIGSKTVSIAPHMVSASASSSRFLL